VSPAQPEEPELRLINRKCAQVHDDWVRATTQLGYDPLIARYVLVKLSYGPSEAFLTVKDSGVGIPASDIDLIGDRFHRVESISRSHEGTGIGISLIKVSSFDDDRSNRLTT
jgi:signal transduction histidine kinase